MAVLATSVAVRVLAQSAPPADTGSNPAVIIIGVLVVTAIVATVVIRRRHRP